MKENRSKTTTLIIGNGFDLSLGMRTDYSSFFQFLEDKNFFKDNARSPLISYIKEKGEQENWFAFEDIISDYALHGVVARKLLYMHKMMDNIEKIWRLDDFALSQIHKYRDLIEDIPSLEGFISTCEQHNYCDLKLLDLLDPKYRDVQKEVDHFVNGVRKECEEVINLLSSQLRNFIKVARPNIEYSPAIKIICALLGCDGKGFNDWADNILELFNREKDKYIFHEFHLLSFNYTDALRLVLSVIEGRTKKSLYDDNTTFVPSVFNIHGDLNHAIAFGTDENNDIPNELWALRKCSNIGIDMKKKFNEILNLSDRIVIFGHSVYGIDFEYYKDYLKKGSVKADIYIVSNTENSLNDIKRGLEEKGVSPRARYVIADIYNDEFCKLCEDINNDQQDPLLKIYASVGKDSIF